MEIKLNRASARFGGCCIMSWQYLWHHTITPPYTVKLFRQIIVSDQP